MRILLHLGYPKVMSKFFQVEIFNNLENVNYFKPYGKTYLLYHEIRNLVLNNSDKEFELRLAKIQNKIQKHLNKKLINIFSDEIYLWPNIEKFDKIFKRLDRIFKIENCEIQYLILTRKQLTLIQSMYSENQEIFLNLNDNFISYENMIKEYFLEQNQSNKEKIFFDCLKFENIIKSLRNNSTNIVHSFSYEDLTLKNISSIEQLSKIFKSNYNTLNQLFSQKPFHVTSKNKKIHLIKNNKIISKFSKFPLSNLIKSLLPLKLKFLIKNIIYKYCSKKVILNKSFNSYINDYYL